MKVIFNYATRQFESMEPTLRDRFALGGRVNYAIGDLVYSDLPGQMGDAKLERARIRSGAVGKDERFVKRLSKGKSSYWPFKSNNVLITQSDIDNSFLVNNLIKKNKGFLASPESFALELFGKTKAGKPVNLKGAMRALVIAMDNFKEAENFRFATDVYKNIDAKKFNYLEMVAKSITQSKNAKNVAESAAAFLPENMVTHYPKTLARGGEKGLFNIGQKIKPADKKFLIDRITKLTGEPINLKQLDETLKFAIDSRTATGRLKGLIKRNAAMNADIKKLYDDPQISKLIRGNLNAADKANILKRAVKLIDDDVSIASRRLFQMAQAIAGTRDIPGIKVDEALGKRIIDTQRIVGKAGNGYAFSGLVYDHYGKVIDKALGATKGKSFIGYYQSNIAKALDAGLVPDEIFGVTASARRGMSPYAIFTQALTEDVNSRIKGANLDSLLSKTHKDLQAIFKGKKYNQLNVADKKSANRIVKVFEDAKKAIIKKEGAKMKNVQLAEFDLKNAPSKSIANYKNLDKNLQKAFDNTYKKVGYSMKVPKEFKTQKQLLESLQKSKGVFKGAAKIGGKVLGPLGVVLGVSAVSTAAKAGESNLFDLASAYLTADPEVATTSRLLREDEKFRQEYMANLPDITQELPDSDEVAGLKETFPGSNMDYLQAVQDGFQGSFEDFLQLQSIPQSDRPITGKLDLPEMDQTMMAAQGGRVGFAEGTPDPFFVDSMIAAFENPNVADQFIKDNQPSVGEMILGEEGDRSLMQSFNTQFLDPRSYPYYAQKTLRGAANIPELAVRFPLAAAYIFGKASLATSTADLSKFNMEDLKTAMEILEPKFTNLALEGKLGDVLGLSPEAIQAAEEKRTGPQKTTGDLLQFTGEAVGPATPLFLFKMFPKLSKQIKDLVGTATAADKVNKEIESRMATQGVDQTRRDLLIATGVGGAVGLLKMLGLDNLFKAAPKAVAKQAPEIITSGGTPKYFFDFVDLIKKKGKNISEEAGTVAREKVYDYNGYTLYEKLDTGEIRIRKDTEGASTYYIGDGEYDTVTGIVKKEEITYTPKETIINDKGKSVEVKDTYDEATLKPDIDGDEGDFEEGLESIDDILELLAKDGKTYSKDDLLKMGIDADALSSYKPKKAGGGIMKMAGDESGPPPKSGPTPHGLPYVAKNVRPIKERK